MRDRRVYFFLGAAILVACLYPFTPEEYRWLQVTLSVTYVVFALLFGAAAVSAEREIRRRHQPGATSPPDVTGGTANPQ